MATYYDGLNDFYKKLEQKRLAGSAQLVYLHLLHLNNRAGNCGYVQVSDQTLGTITSLSKDSITRAKQILKNAGLIDFHTNRKKPREATAYTLTFFNAGQNAGQGTGQNAGQNAGQAFNYHTLDKYKKEKEKESTQACKLLEELEKQIKW